MCFARIITGLVVLFLHLKLSGQAWDWSLPVTSADLEVVGGMDVSEGNDLGVIAGTFSQTLPALPGNPAPATAGQAEPLVFTFDLLGNPRAATSFPASAASEAQATALNAQGAVFVGGSFRDSLDVSGTLASPNWLENTLPGPAGWLVRCDSTLQSAWALQLDGTVSSSIEEIALAGSLLFAGGHFEGTLTVPGLPSITSAGQGDVFVLAVDPASGTPLWLQGLHSAQPVSLRGISAEGSQVFVTGIFRDTTLAFAAPGPALATSAQQEDIYIAALDAPTGQAQWLEAAFGLGAQVPHALTAANGNVYLVGEFENTLNLGTGSSATATMGSDAWMACYAGANGQYQWLRSFAGASTGTARAALLRIKMGPDNLLYVAGAARDSFHLAPGTVAADGGNSLLVVARFDDQGNYAGWFTTASAPGVVSARGLFPGSTGIYTAGNYTGSNLNFFNQPALQAPSNGNANMFAARLNCPSTTWGAVSISDTAICGNDSLSITIANSDNAFFYTLLDNSGNPLTNPTPGNSGLLTLTAGPLTSNGTLSVELTSGTPGCSEIFPQAFPYQITSSPKPDLGPDTTICQNIPLTLSTPGSYVSYSWNTNETTPTISVNSASEYILKVQDAGGCFGSDSIVVEVLLPPNAILDNQAILCEGDSLTLQPVACADCSHYLWSNGDTTAATVVDSGGPYVLTTFTMTDPSSQVFCQENDTVWVDEIIFSTALAPDTTICAGDSAVLVVPVPAQSYLWSTGSTDSSIVVVTAGLYSVEMTQGSCVGNDSINVSVEAAPTVNLGADTAFCGGDSLVLVGGGPGNTYTWQDGSTADTLTISQSGSYAVTVTSPAGCQASDGLQLTIFSNPNAFISGLDTIYCVSEGPQFFVAAPGGGQFFEGPVSGNVFDPSAIGQGNFTIGYAYQDTNGCVDTVRWNVSVDATPTPPDAGPDQTISSVTSLELQGNSPAVGMGNWTIDPPGPTFSDPGDAQAVVSGLLPGTYTLTWTIDKTVCPSQSDAFTLVVNALSIPTGFSPNGDEVNDRFVIRGIENYPVRRLMVFNRWGNEVYRSDRYDNEWGGESLSDDTYYFSLDLGETGEYSGFVVLKR